MKQFLIKIFLFFFPICVVMVTLEFALRRIPNEYSVKIQNFERVADEVQILILGSSHALRGINPNELDGNAYSLAMVSQPIEIDYKLLVENIDHMPNLRKVIVSVSYFSLTKKISEGEIVNRLPFYRIFYDLEMDGLKANTFAYHSLLSTVGLGETWRKIYKFYILDKNIVKCDSKGWLGSGGENLDAKAMNADGARAAKRHEDNSLDFAHNLNLMQQMIAIAEARHFQLVFVNTPKTKEYVNHLSQEKRKMIDNAIKQITNKSADAVYLNFENHPDFEVADFRNSDHLNEDGAKKLTRLLNSTYDIAQSY